MDGAPGPKVPYNKRLRPMPPSWGDMASPPFALLTGESREGVGPGGGGVATGLGKWQASTKLIHVAKSSCSQQSLDLPRWPISTHRGARGGSYRPSFQEPSSWGAGQVH